MTWRFFILSEKISKKVSIFYFLSKNTVKMKPV